MGFQHRDKYRYCGAKTRAGHPCKQPAMKHSKRCRKHGGKSLRGTASPHFKHGYYSKDVMSRFAWSQISRCWHDVIFDIRAKRLVKKGEPDLSHLLASKRSRARSDWIQVSARRLGQDIPPVPIKHAEELYRAWCEGHLKETIIEILTNDKAAPN